MQQSLGGRVPTVYLAAYRRPLVTLAVVSTMVVSACDPFGPRPNETLLRLAESASASSDSVGDPAYRAQRREHAEQLYKEVERLCGFREDGSLVETCEYERRPGSPSPDPLGMYLSAIDSVPKESRPLVIDQAIDIAARDRSDLLKPDITDSDDLEAARELLRREHATVYALETERALDADPDLTDHLVDIHDRLILALRAVIPSPPVAEPGYRIEEGATVEDIQESMKQAWRASALHARSPEARAFFVRAAGLVEDKEY